jgi:hypothetical protein
VLGDAEEREDLALAGHRLKSASVAELDSAIPVI